ncbi:hypothetical protein GCM10027343_40230 [Noviherbaspirillum agri]
MMNSPKLAARFIALGALIAGLAACEKQDATEGKGPAEQAGRQIDQAASRAGEELNKAAEKAGQGLQELGQKMQDESKEAQESTRKE